MGGGSPETPKTDYNKDITSFVNGLTNSFPKVLNAEKKYRGDFSELNLKDIDSFLRGTGGTKGLAGLQKNATKTANAQLLSARNQELRGMRDSSSITRSLLESISPESAAAVKASSEAAARATESAKGLSGQEARSAQQFAREGSASRGRLLDNSSIASEVLNRESVLGQKRQEAASANQQAYQMANSFYSAPGLQALSSVPNSYQQGQGLLGISLSSLGSAKPQLIDIGAGLNLGAANRQNQFAANSAQQQAQAQRQGSYVTAGATAGATYGSAFGPWGTLIGGVAGAGAGYAAG